MKKIKAFVILAILFSLSSISCAGVIDLDEKNIVDGAYIIQDNTTYKILYKTQTYFNGDMLQRLVVENLNEISEAQGMFDQKLSEIDGMRSYMLELTEKKTQLKPELDKMAVAKEITERQYNVSKTGMDALREREKELKTIITSNILVSGSNYNIAIIAFIILIVLVLFFKGKGLLERSEKPEKPKGKKGSLELVAEQIKGKPDEKKVAEENEKGFEYSIDYEAKPDNDK